MTWSRVAWGLAAIDMLAFVVAASFDPKPDYGAFVLYILGIGAYVGIGALLVSRVPTNPIGALLLATGTLVVAAAVVGTYADVGVLQHPQWPGVVLARTVGDAMFIYPILIALVGIPLVFPDGHLPSRRFRWVVLLLITGMIGWMFGSVFNAPIDGIVLVSVPVAFGGAVTAISLRFRRGDPIQRQQVKWLAAVVIVGAVAVLAGLLLFEVSPGLSNALIIVGILALFAMPFVIGIAILRYRLYEIDRIVSRTLSYAVVTGILAVVFGGIVLFLQTVLTSFTEVNNIAVAASTLAVFALFQPVLRRVRRAVDRRFDRARYDAEQTSAAFSERLRWQTDIDLVTADLERTASGAIAPTTLGIWLRDTGRGHPRS